MSPSVRGSTVFHRAARLIEINFNVKRPIGHV